MIISILALDCDCAAVDTDHVHDPKVDEGAGSDFVMIYDSRYHANRKVEVGDSHCCLGNHCGRCIGGGDGHDAAGEADVCILHAGISLHLLTVAGVCGRYDHDGHSDPHCHDCTMRGAYLLLAAADDVRDLH